MKKYSMLSVVRKMQIKTKMRKLTPTRMAKIKKTDTYQMLDRTQSNRLNNTLWVGVQKGTILWEKFWNFPIKSIIQLPYGTTIPYLGVYTKEIKTCSQKTCIRTSTIPKIFNYQKLGTAQVIFNREMGSEAYLYNRVWPSKKKAANATCMNLKIMVNEVLPKSTFYTIPCICNSKIRKMYMCGKKIGTRVASKRWG